MLLAGVVLFALARPLLPLPGEPIVVEARTLDDILEREADGLGRDLTPDERDARIQRHVDEEILLREAYRRGLHQASAPVRARLLRRMRLALSEGIPQPSRSQLRAYFNTNSARYRTPESVTFAHVFYERGASTLPEDPGAPVHALARGDDFSALGDAFWLGPVLGPIAQERLAATLGPEFAEAVFRLPVGEWRGPMESSRGTHYVAVVERHEPTIPPFESVEALVEQEWLTERRADLVERRLSRMRARYRIEYEGPPRPSSAEGA